MNFKRNAMIILSLIICLTFLPNAAAENVDAQIFKDKYNLQQHSEGGWFAEIYTAPFKQKKHRATAGSIYFLLEREDVSHFHRLDCDEIWYYHAGGGMKIFVLQDGQIKEYILSSGAEENSQPMVVIPAGAIFAAENLDKDGYTFISCVTTPRFDYKGFRLISKAELKKIYPRISENLLRMAYDKI